MLFNSLPYWGLLIIVFVIYWGLLKNSIKLQNILLLIASYIFYGWWDYRFLSLIIISTLIDFFTAQFIDNTREENKRKLFLLISLFSNLGLLAYFKYYNFFIDNWIEMWDQFGIKMNPESLNLILPVGISFYTFQTLSYTIDVYRNQIKPTKSILDFAVFVAFFPQLVAGPIERASHLLPQFSKRRIFNQEWAISGLHLIIWGLFKKLVIADTCAIYVNSIFGNYENLNSGSLLLGAIYFSFQIYGDFSGYSDIAIGTARLLGFDLMQNFKYPYFARNIGEFWRRWHISLSTWFRDYLYIPLGGSKSSKRILVRNIAIVFLISGFWHGAKWNFIIWGGFHALCFMPVLLLNKNKKYFNVVAQNKILPSTREVSQILTTFLIVTLGWIVFRADTLEIAGKYIFRMLSNLNFNIQYLGIERYNVEILLLIGLFLALEWIHRNTEHPFTGKWKWYKLLFIIFLILISGVFSDYQDFIYFQF